MSTSGFGRRIDVFISYSHASDAALAPALQRGMSLLGKKWNQQQVLRVYRDDTNLSASTDVTAEIYRAVDEARYFLLLASPKAAQSNWVAKEVARWRLNDPRAQRFLIAVTDGTATWDSEAEDFTWSATDALSRSLSGYFTTEPNWVNLQWAHGAASLTLQNDRFRSAVAKLAAPAHIPSKTADELDNEHARQHRIVNRIRNAVTAVLAALLVIASVSLYFAVTRSNEAVRQRDTAVAEQLIAQSESIGESDPRLARLDSLAAWRIHPSDQARRAMLAAAAMPGLAILTGHTEAVWAVAFSPDGKTLATGSVDHTVRLWDVATHRPRGVLVGHSGPIQSVAFSPDGKTLATGSLDHTVRLWNVAARAPEGEPLVGHTDHVTSVAFSPDGKTLASGSVDHTVRLWDVATHHLVSTLLVGPFAASSTGILDAVDSVAFSPDGKFLATGSADHTARLWDVATTSQIGPSLTGHTDAVDSVAFSPDGKILATGSTDHTARLWDIASPSPTSTLLAGHTDAVTSVAFSHDGTTLATGSWDQTVRLWNVTTRRPIGTPLTGHTSAIQSVAFGRDGTTLATGSADHTARLWRVTTGHSISDQGEVVSAAFSPDSATVATGGEDGTAQLWKVATQREVGDLTRASSGPPSDPDTIESVAFSPDGKTLATAGLDYTVQLWNVAGRYPIGDPLTGHTSGVFAMAFSPDGKTLATGSADKTVRLWDVAAHHLRGTLTGNIGRIESVAFSPDGTTLVAGSHDDMNARVMVRSWDTATLHSTRDFVIDRVNYETHVVLSPDGRTVAVGDLDGSVRLWDVATRQAIGDPLNQNDRVAAMVFSPDSKTLAIGSVDDSVRLWDIATHRMIGDVLEDYVAVLLSVVFSPDNKTLAIVSAANTVQLWDVGYLADVVSRLCTDTGDSLTPAEWNRSIHGPAYRQICP